ncbi:hypothetical protein ACEWPM_014380 [Roseovarius sp. S4756]|uniref:hypothetical protein n=1 Tax=Roseovarius maritimus TaxID=3342637 RepID=UPI003726218F
MTNDTKQHLPIDLRVEHDDHIIGYLPGTGSRLVVSLSSVGKRRWAYPPWEFIGTASDGGRNHVLLVSERARTWMNAPGLAEAIAAQIEHVVREHRIKEVVALGNSMGGFMALVLPQYTKVDRVVATSAQFSMHPDIVPEDGRWALWRTRMPAFRHETIGAIDAGARDHFILHGSTKNENLHWGRFPYDPALHHYIIQGKGHSVVIAMKGSGIMGEVLGLAIDGHADAAVKALSTRYRPIRRSELPPEQRMLWPR